MTTINLTAITKEIARAVVTESHPTFFTDDGRHYVVADHDGSSPRVIFRMRVQLDPWVDGAIVVPVADALTPEAEEVCFWDEEDGEDEDDDDRVIFAMSYVADSTKRQRSGNDQETTWEKWRRSPRGRAQIRPRVVDRHHHLQGPSRRGGSPGSVGSGG